jgi:hypothetical protein
VVIIVALGVYWPVLTYDFIQDDWGGLARIQVEGAGAATAGSRAGLQGRGRIGIRQGCWPPPRMWYGTSDLAVYEASNIVRSADGRLLVQNAAEDQAELSMGRRHERVSSTRVEPSYTNSLVRL